MDAHRSVGPPEEGLRVGSAIVEAHPQFHVGFAGMQTDAVHPLHARHGVVIGTPDGHAAVRCALDGTVNRHERGGAVMLRPVELDAAGDPRTGQADQRRLDDVLAIKEVVAVHEILTDMNAAAQFGQDHEADELILEMNGRPGAIDGRGFNAVNHGKRINAAAGALVDALFEEEGIPVRRGRHPGAHCDGLFPCFHRAGFGGRSGGQLQSRRA